MTPAAQGAKREFAELLKMWRDELDDEELLDVCEDVLGRASSERVGAMERMRQRIGPQS